MARTIKWLGILCLLAGWIALMVIGLNDGRPSAWLAWIVVLAFGSGVALLALARRLASHASP